MQKKPRTGGVCYMCMSVWLHEASAIHLFSEVYTNHQRQRWQNTAGLPSVYFRGCVPVWCLHLQQVGSSFPCSVFSGQLWLFFFLWVLWCNYFVGRRNKNQNTYLIFESFPSPETQTFHPVCWLCFFSSTFAFVKHSQEHSCFVRLTQCNDSSQRAWKLKKHQHIPFVFNVYLTTDSQRSLTYKNAVQQKYFQTAFK